MKRPLVITAFGIILGEILFLAIDTNTVYLFILFFMAICGYVAYLIFSNVEKYFIFVFFVFFLIGYVICDTKNNTFTSYDEYTEGKIYTDTGIVREAGDDYIVVKTDFYSYIRLYCYDDIYSLYGVLLYPEDEISFSYEYVLLTGASNFGNFDFLNYYHSKGIAANCLLTGVSVTNEGPSYKKYIERLKDSCKEIIYELMPEDKASVAAGIVLGLKSDVDKDTVALYSKYGIAHILAISGMHIMIVGGVIYNLIRKITGNKPAGVISMIIMISYGILTGSSVSVLRAVIMYIIMLLARLLGCKYDFLSALSFACIVLLIKNPMYIINSSFLLSFSAVFGAAVFYPEIRNVLKLKGLALTSKEIKYKRLKLLFHRESDNLISGIFMYIFTLPLISFFFFQIPVYGVLLNMFVIPLLSYMTC